MEQVELKLSWGDKKPWDTNEPIDVTMEFKSVNKLRRFINGSKKLFKISKIKNTSIDATVERISIREHNLDLILEGNF